MRIPAKIANLSTSILLTFAALTLLIAPVQIVQTLLFSRGTPFWYPGLIIGTVLLRAFISYGLFERKSWAWLLYSLDKILFLALYGIRYIQAESLPYVAEERAGLLVPTILTAGKLVLALLAYKDFTPNYKKHLMELWKNWRKAPKLDSILKQMKEDPVIRVLLVVYFALTLGSQTMGQLYTTLLVWANTLQTAMPWLKLSVLIANDNFWTLLLGSTILSILGIYTGWKQKAWGWKLIIMLFFFAFLLALPRQLKLVTGNLEMFWMRRAETLLSFLWLAGTAFWLSLPQKGQRSSWQKGKAKV
jgi:hypothetical protein